MARDRPRAPGARRLRLALALVILAALAGAAQPKPARAYVESQGEPWGTSPSLSGAACQQQGCHGGALHTPGVHTGYGSTTDKCIVCHSIHEAAESSRLLPTITITELCNTCHDLSFSATGGEGVYGTIRAKGGVVLARHGIASYNETETSPSDGSTSYEATSNVPGGDAAVTDREGSVTDLECVFCHTPHGNTSMPAFLSDRRRADGFNTRYGWNKALRDDLQGTPKGTYSTYGTMWCAACHDRRHSGAPVDNHPTQNDDAWWYRDVTYTVISGVPGPGLGLTNAGYTMYPAATPPSGNGRVENRQPPMCQQCHEDLRDVETAFVDSVVAEDDDSLMPRFRTFPHETEAARMTLETGDDLCLNCHPTDMLP